MVKLHALLTGGFAVNHDRVTIKEEGLVVKNFDNAIFNFLQKESLIALNNRVLLACSGGVDSIVMLHFFAVNRKRLGIEVGAVHVDHMLRGEESAADGILVKELCESLGVPFYGGRVPVPEILAKDGGNVQAVCREGRYAFFADVMREQHYGVLATAHHAEDQLETVLMQVTKGVTPLGFPVKRPIDGGRLIRPFLAVVKESLYNYAAENKLSFNEDPSNDSEDYVRNRFRRNVVPHILSENPKAPEGVVAFAGELQEDEAFLQELAKERLEKIVRFTDAGLPVISIQRFSSMPTALQKRMIPLLLGYLYDEINETVIYKSTLIEQIMHHVKSKDGNVSINMPLGYQFIREYDKLTFRQGRNLPNPNSEELKVLPKGEQTEWMDGIWIYWTEADDAECELYLNAKEIMYFNLPKESLPLFVRQRTAGDRILLSGMTSSKRLSRLFIDEKVSQSKRASLPVVVTSNNEVCAIPGLRYGTAFTKDHTNASKYIFILGEQ